MDPQVGQLINNKYRLVRLIGDGGMGSVWEARHELLGTSVALKFLHATLARRPGLVERFLQEARVSARIKSPHVVAVTDVDRTPEGLAYMVMEYVEGETLQRLYERLYEAGKRLSYGDAFAFALQIVEGIAAAHREGIVHRDLKPDNVMLTLDSKGQTLVKILDFGIAKLKASGEAYRGLTRPGVVMGTPEYMAPEQAFSADKVDARADIFSLGVMLFEMLAGRRPVGGDNAHAIAAQYFDGSIARLTDLAPAISAGLAEAVHRAMSAKPEQRFASIEDFRQAIEPFAPEGPRHVHPSRPDQDAIPAAAIGAARQPGPHAEQDAVPTAASAGAAAAPAPAGPPAAVAKTLPDDQPEAAAPPDGLPAVSAAAAPPPAPGDGGAFERTAQVAALGAAALVLSSGQEQRADAAAAPPADAAAAPPADAAAPAPAAPAAAAPAAP
ncbi:MAG: serine/threonine protein kinase, partial [Deltaproteobacteria bacterium]|nr:serine/threonine protein kinase [Deltaproteobacteria bacterium]